MTAITASATALAVNLYSKDFQNLMRLTLAAEFIKTHSDSAAFCIVEVESSLKCLCSNSINIKLLHHAGEISSALNFNSVKELLIRKNISNLFEFSGNFVSKFFSILRDRFQSLRSVVNCIHSAHCGHKCSSRADVGSSLLSLNVLLSCLKRQPYRLVSQTVYGNSYDTARNASLILLSGCQIAGSWSAVTHWESESLSASNSNVCTPGSRLFQNSKSKNVTVSGYHAARLVHLCTECGVVSNLSVCCRVLNHSAKAHWVSLKLIPLSHNYLNAKTFCASLKNALNLREELVIYKEYIFASLNGISAAEVEHNSHCLCCSLCIVQH